MSRAGRSAEPAKLVAPAMTMAVATVGLHAFSCSIKRHEMDDWEVSVRTKWCCVGAKRGFSLSRSLVGLGPMKRLTRLDIKDGIKWKNEKKLCDYVIQK